jgi:hypothetical protein
VNFYKTGDKAVCADAQYQLLNGRSPRSDGVPWIVADAGTWLEQSRTGLEQAGIPCPTPWRVGNATVGVRHRCYFYPDNAPGSTPLGGPIFMASQLADFDRRDIAGSGAVIRATVTHELFHLAQDGYFNWAKAHLNAWWIEMCGAYMGDWYWAQHGDTTNVVGRFYLNSAPKLPALAMREQVDPEHYAFAAFPAFLDRKHNGSGFKFVKAANESGDLSYAGLDAAARAAIGMSLSDAYLSWAKDYYYDDLWSGQSVARYHVGVSPAQQADEQSAASQAFTRVRLGAAGNPKAIRNDFETVNTGSFPALTARTYPVIIDGLPKKAQGKLVVSLTGAGASAADFRVLAGADRLGTKVLPRSGSPNGLRGIPLSPDRVQNIFKVGGDDADRVTLIVINQNLAAASNGPVISRWLLQAPSFCNFERSTEGSRKWTVSWARADLKDSLDIFQGYEVWARKVGEAAENRKLLLSTTDEIKQIEMPDDEDYVFYVRVQDKFQNFGEYSEADGDDPFQGEWIGRIFLVEGSFAEPLVKWMDKQREATAKKSAAKIASLPPDQQAAAQRSDQADAKQVKEIADLAANMLRQGEKLTRLGIPTRFKITRANGEYKMKVLSCFWQKIDEKDAQPVDLVRVNGTKLTLKEKPPEMPPFYLELTRKGPNEISTPQGWSVETKIDSEPAKFTLKWLFVRQNTGKTGETP